MTPLSLFFATKLLSLQRSVAVSVFVSLLVFAWEHILVSLPVHVIFASIFVFFVPVFLYLYLFVFVCILGNKVAVFAAQCGGFLLYFFCVCL